MEKDAFISACREGGAAMERASRTIDSAYAALLLRECRMVVRDVHQTHDIVQETCIRVWKRCSTYRGESELLTWMRGIMRNAIVDHFRRLTHDEPMEDEQGLTPAVAERVAQLSDESLDRPDEHLAIEQREACYRRCFARFERAHPLHAAVMRWIAEDDLSNAQIEALLQRTPGATREFISQCRKKARVHFEEWYAMTWKPDGD